MRDSSFFPKAFFLLLGSSRAGFSPWVAAQEFFNWTVRPSFFPPSVRSLPPTHPKKNTNPDRNDQIPTHRHQSRPVGIGADRVFSLAYPGLS